MAASGEPPNPFHSVDAMQAHLAAIVASSDDAIVSKNLNGIVQTWNQAAARIFGYTAEEMIGQPIARLLPPDRPDEERQILERLRRGERVDHFETVRRHKDGHLLDISVTISPIRDRDGTIIGASKIARDITAFKALIREREALFYREQAARQEAERLNRIKDEFLATLSHELRTPLNAILGWAQLLRSKLPNPDHLEQGLETIDRNARAQTRLIEDLLDISRVISGKMRLDVQRVDLQTVISAAIESVRPAAENKNVRLLQIIDPKAGPITGDPARLQQVIWNLLTNAVKFTPKGGSVQVFLQRINSHVEITVADTGQGIPPEFLPRLFTRFAQADSSTTRQHTGLGLGLAIVRHLVELHGGRVHASSPGEGKGATFTVALPLAAVYDSRVPAEAAHPTTDRHEAANTGPRPKVNLHGVKVLVVDDERDARDLIKHILEMSGGTVMTAGSAREAIEVFQRERPDVLLSDVGMPEEDGYQLIRQVRALPRNAGGGVPAVAFTAFARAEDRRQALMAGFQFHLAKPVEALELLTVVASLTGATNSATGAS